MTSSALAVPLSHPVTADNQERQLSHHEVYALPMAPLWFNAHPAEITNRNVAQVLGNDILFFGSSL